MFLMCPQTEGLVSALWMRGAQIKGVVAVRHVIHAGCASSRSCWHHRGSKRSP